MTFETILHSPDPFAVQVLNRGDLLDIELIEIGHSEVIGAKTRPNGMLAGTIIGISYLEILIVCLEKFAYEAQVLMIEGSQVRIRVRRNSV